MTEPLAIGVDVGGTKIEAVLANRQGHVLAERRTFTLASEGADAVVSRIAGVARSLHEDAPGPVAGVGIGIPGYIDPAPGIVRNAVNLGWQELDLVARLRRQLDLPIWVGNDANVLALGEYVFGAARGCSNFVYISIGSGMGGGIVLGGRLLIGSAFAAAELGHMSLDPEGRLCACGQRGCVEAVVSGPGILATARERLARGEASSLHDSAELTSHAVLQAAQEGDRLALAAFDETAVWLGAVFAIYVAVVNPQRIVIGGGMGLAAFDLLVPGALAELKRRVTPQISAQLQAVRSQVATGAVGASSLVWQTAES